MLEFSSSAVSMPLDSITEFNNISSLSTVESFDYNTSEYWNKSFDNLNDTISLYERCDPDYKDFNCTIEEYLFVRLGAKAQPLDEAIWVTIFFVGIFATGVIGNFIVCFVIIRNSSMHTATNYYLFSLAVSDLIFLMMGLPFDLSLYWHQYPYNMGLTFCKMRALISEASTYVSVLTIVAFSMERFLAICHPLHLYTMSGLQRAVRIIAALWVISFLSAVPFAVFTKIHYLKYPKTNEEIPESAFCAMLDYPHNFPLWEVSTCVFFAFPMVIMAILYMRMGLKIRSRTRHTVALGVQQGSIHGESKQSQSRRAIIRMLAAVVITFFVCWAPFHAQRLLFLYGQGIESFKLLNQWVFAVSGWLYYVSCTINPILYNVMSHRYRIAFRETLCNRKRGYYSSANGFARDQSSFRETTIAGAGRDHNLNYEGSHLLRTKSSSSYRSVRYKDNSRQGNSMRWKENNSSVKRVDSIKSNDSTRSNNSTSSNCSGSNVIVVCKKNGFKTKCIAMSNKLLPTSSFDRNGSFKSTSKSSMLRPPSSPRSPIRKHLHSTSSYESERMNNLLEEDEDDELNNKEKKDDEKNNENEEKISINDLPQSRIVYRNGIRNETSI